MLWRPQPHGGCSEGQGISWVSVLRGAMRVGKQTTAWLDCYMMCYVKDDGGKAKGEASAFGPAVK